MGQHDPIPTLWRNVYALALRDWRRDWLNGHLGVPADIRNYFDSADGKFLAHANRMPITKRDVECIIEHVTAPYGEGAIEQVRGIAVA